LPIPLPKKDAGSDMGHKPRRSRNQRKSRDLPLVPAPVVRANEQGPREMDTTTAKANQQGAQDLAAEPAPQDRWTRWATVAMAVATIVYAILVWRQLAVMGRQLGVMDGQLRQMQVASRAWVGLANATSTPIVAGKKIGFDLRFTNTGETPANKVVISCAIYIGKEGCDIESLAATDVELMSSLPMQRAIAPNAIVSMRDFTPQGISESAGVEINAGRMIAYIFGRASYDDIFGEKHTTEYCFTIDPSTGRLEAYRQYNRMD
jgi:hypothetical protein